MEHCTDDCVILRLIYLLYIKCYIYMLYVTNANVYAMQMSNFFTV